MPKIGPQCWTEDQLRAELDRYESELRSSGKTRNTIATYVQHPERFINWLVGSYRPAPDIHSRGEQPTARTPRYEPLTQYLSLRAEPVVKMSFADVERVLGRPLPASARRHRPWWANEQGGTHSHALAWLGAGRRTANVDLNFATVEFIRT